METKEYYFFGKTDDNDSWQGNCMSLVCEENHKLRKNPKLDMHISDMDYAQFFDVFEYQLNEREEQCVFCKKCFNCRRFRLLCYEWHRTILNSNRKNGIYCTAVRFCKQNLRYPKTQCITLDFLNSRPVDDEFKNFVEKKEKIIFDIANEFRKVKVW